MMYGWMDGWMDRDDRYRERQMQEMLQQMWQNEHLVNLGDDMEFSVLFLQSFC